MKKYFYGDKKVDKDKDDDDYYDIFADDDFDNVDPAHRKRHQEYLRQQRLSKERAEAKERAYRARQRKRYKSQAKSSKRPKRPTGYTKRERALRYLNLPLDADDKTIKKRYNTLLKKYHPDTNGGSRKYEKKLTGAINAFKATKE